MGCGDVLGPVYYENVEVWLDEDVVGAEVCVNYSCFLVGSFDVA